MLIKLLQQTAASGEDLLAGCIATVSEKDGETLIKMGKAEAYIEPEAPKEKAKKA